MTGLELRVQVVIILSLCVFVVSCSGAFDSPRVQAGDLVSVNFTATTENGELVKTTYEKTANDPGVAKSSYFETGAAFAPEDVIAGQSSGSIPGLGEAVLGMAAGEKKKVVITPDKAYGPSDPAKRKEFPCVRNMPKTIRMSPREYENDFHSFPVIGKEVAITPYFKAGVVEVTEQYVALDCLVKDGDRFEVSYGTVNVKVDERHISMVLAPRLGSMFPMGGKSGKIVATDGTKFTVDANNPLAGIPLTVSLEVLSVTNAARLEALKIPWVEDYDQGIATAREERKPAVLVLYADWCQFCKRLFGETLQDPRIKALNDRFVWIKVNSDTNKQYGEMYKQNGFPLILVLNREGQPVDRMEGFKDAVAFRDELVKTSKNL